MVTKAEREAAKLKELAEDDESQMLFTADEVNHELEGIKADLGIEGDSDTTVHVSKIDADGTGEAKCFMGPVDQYNLEQIARKFGTASYRVKVYIKIPTGQKVVKYNKVMRWILSPDDEAKRLKAVRDAENGVTVAPAAQDSSAVVSAIMAGFQAQNATLAGVLERIAQPSDKLGELKQLAEVFRAMQPPAVTAVHAEKPMGFMEMLTAFSAFQNVAKGMNPAPLPENTDAGTMLMAKAMETFGPMLTQGRAAQAPAPALENKPATPANAAQPNAEQSEQIELTPEQEEEMIMMTLMLKQAIRAAKAKDDPKLYAESVFSLASTEIILEMATDPEWFAALCNMNAECKDYQPFFAAVRQTLIDTALADGDLIRDANGVLQIAPDDEQEQIKQ